MELDFSKTLITGANGVVGGYIDFGIKTDRQSMDITNLKEVLAVANKYKPNVILHLAAETDLDRCERDPEHAFLTNSVGTYNMSVAARDVKAKLVYVSTAGVFDGEKASPYTTSDKPNPKNLYGHSKYLGELAVIGNLDDYIIVRACWMMGGGPEKDRKFVAKIVRQLRDPAVKEIKAITDQVGAPTFAKDLVVSIKRLIAENKSGIFHLSNTGRASRYDVAKEIIKVLKSNIPVVPVDSSYFNLDAKRTNNEMLEVDSGYMRPWQEALREYLETEWQAPAITLKA